MLFLPLIITALGGFLFIKLGAFPLRHPLKMARICARGAGREGFLGLALALAGTLGVGNIFGVAISISVGGAGSVLWLFVSGFFAAVIKYAEVLVCVDRRKSSIGQGGMMYLVAERLRHGRALGVIYAAVCLALSLTMGAAMQSSAAVSSASLICGVKKPLFAAAFMILAFAFIFGRRERIKQITAFLIPLAGVLYIFLTLAVIFRYYGEIPRVIGEIFADAFRPRSFVGGVLGYLSASPIVRGYSTGILSNEAGAGTSSMAHASAEGDPVASGILGMLEVFCDTALLCTLTAFAILLPSGDLSGKSAAELVTSSLAQIFPRSDAILLLSVSAFALATVVCWYFYGTVCMRYLFGSRGGLAFLALYSLAVVLGAIFDCSVFASLSDLLLLVLTLLTAPVLIKSSDRIRYLSEQSGLVN